MYEIDDFGDDDLIGWDEWPTARREPTQKPRTDLPPIHEPEPGLLDEEILPLRDDWLRGPEKGLHSRLDCDKKTYEPRRKGLVAF